MHFQNIHAFTYQKTINTLLLLVFKIVEYLQFILKVLSFSIKILRNLKTCFEVLFYFILSYFENIQQFLYLKYLLSL